MHILRLNLRYIQFKKYVLNETATLRRYILKIKPIQTYILRLKLRLMNENSTVLPWDAKFMIFFFCKTYFNAYTSPKVQVYALKKIIFNKTAKFRSSM